MDPQTFDDEFERLVTNATALDIQSQEATTAINNLKNLASLRPKEPSPEPTPEVIIPMTKWERIKAGIKTVWDNETTRVVIKSGGALAGVLAVTYTTIQKDHVLERQATAQANQKPVG